ncbi:cytochrome P450 [Amycolatopsis sp. NPDC051071]|uniref:cytochrome P450 n=1 Tax=Amycolatopsis sp. NPDC051071 TaxID=3154637 RepID=UPI003430C89E
MFRSIVAPVGSSLAWSVLLACLHHTADSPWSWPPGQIVRAALRHRPMVGRALSRPTELGGTAFSLGDVLSVSPYLVHHDEHHWSDPEMLRPERWAEPGERGNTRAVRIEGSVPRPSTAPLSQQATTTPEGGERP